MTIEENKLFTEGRFYWQAYVNLNGYAFYPTEKGLVKLSRNLDLNLKYLRKCINVFLEA